MSIKSSHLERFSYFYLGNTPAVCLLQDLPPEDDANVLLLECGDVRNVLFATYATAKQDRRKLDVTCCDVSAKTLARNIIAYTLIADDVSGVQSQTICNIYYDVKVEAPLRTRMGESSCSADAASTIVQRNVRKRTGILQDSESHRLERVGRGNGCDGIVAGSYVHELAGAAASLEKLLCRKGGSGGQFRSIGVT
ncbi:hypothetical protein P171DRAFT_84450 [Karstenula rhodostoma CBS 690.94]|uniref:DUF4470 domain-containing protein n=1 Tax=Karstenula rhodostoma CBS 690.94 TaxID=1392251 RepID=A0A9P4PDA5_9PLEO|nr:hypothetical protein P171DRAFT_84450 [Karstenula rhodostoma CBS 690.94]